MAAVVEGLDGSHARTGENQQLVEELFVGWGSHLLFKSGSANHDSPNPDHKYIQGTHNESSVNLAFNASTDSTLSNLVNICQGNFSNIPRPKEKVVRIFVSSTFSDTHVERTYLMKTLFPRLKEMCKERYGVEFQYVDMRWGVRDEMADDHQTENLCQNEIANCKRVSAGPYFLALIGQRYGSVLPPRAIDQQEFNHLLRAAEEGGHVYASRSLTKWYQLDENSVPPEYLIKPITAEIPGYGNEDGQIRRKAAKTWSSESNALMSSLQLCAELAGDSHTISEEAKNEYFCSVTEKEVISGLLECDDSDAVLSRALVIYRDITDIQEHLNHTKAWRFIDMVDDVVDEHTQAKLQDLRNRISDKMGQAVYPPKHMLTQFSSVNGENTSESEKYLVEFEKCIAGPLVDLLTKTIGNGQSVTTGDSEGSISTLAYNVEGSNLYYEITSHAAKAKDMAGKIQGRDEIMSKIICYLDPECDKANTNHPLVVYGNSGIGKSCIMGAVGFEAKKMWPDSVVFMRFLGTSSLTSSVSGVLYSLWAQLYLALSSYRGDNSSGIMMKVLQAASRNTSLHKHMLSHLLKHLPENQRVIIVLDSLDQLSSGDKAYQLDWLPWDLPKHVRIVLSTLPLKHGILLNAKRKFKQQKTLKDSFLRVSPLGDTTCMCILQQTLSENGRKLTPTQTAHLQKLFQQNGVGLYVQLVSQEALKWRSFDSPETSVVSSAVKKVIHKLFHDLEVKHGSHLVRHALGYITAVDSGLTEEELEHILSLDDEVLNSVFQYHVPPIRRLPPLLWTRLRADLGQFLSNRLWHANAKKFTSKNSVNVTDGRMPATNDTLTNGPSSAELLEQSSTVVSWFHRQFKEVAKERFLSDEQVAQKLHRNLAELYLGTWAEGREKPFLFTERLMKKFKMPSPEGKADRKVPSQPLVVLKTSDGKVLPPDESGMSDVMRIYTVDLSSVTPHFNHRKLLSLPFILQRAGMLDTLHENCYFNPDWLIAKKMTTLDADLVADFNLVGTSDKQIRLLKEVVVQPSFTYVGDCPIPFFLYDFYSHLCAVSSRLYKNPRLTSLLSSFRAFVTSVSPPFLPIRGFSNEIDDKLDAILDTDSLKVECMERSVDGLHLVALAGSSLYFWEVQTFKLVARLYHDALPLFKSLLILSSSQCILYAAGEGRIGSFVYNLSKETLILSSSVCKPGDDSLVQEDVGEQIPIIRGIGKFTSLVSSGSTILTVDRNTSATVYDAATLSCLKSYDRAVVDASPHDAEGFFFVFDNKVMSVSRFKGQVACAQVFDEVDEANRMVSSTACTIVAVAFDFSWKYLFVVSSRKAYVFDCIRGCLSWPAYSTASGCTFVRDWYKSCNPRDEMQLIASHGLAVSRGEYFLQGYVPNRPYVAEFESTASYREELQFSLNGNILVQKGQGFRQKEKGFATIIKCANIVASTVHSQHGIDKPQIDHTRFNLPNVEAVLEIGGHLAIRSEESGLITIMNPEGKQSYSSNKPKYKSAYSREDKAYLKKNFGLTPEEVYSRFTAVISRFSANGLVAMTRTWHRKSSDSAIPGTTVLCKVHMRRSYDGWMAESLHETPQKSYEPKLAEGPVLVCVSEKLVADINQEGQVHVTVWENNSVLSTKGLFMRYHHLSTGEPHFRGFMTFSESGDTLILFQYSERKMFIMSMETYLDAGKVEPAKPTTSLSYDFMKGDVLGYVRKFKSESNKMKTALVNHKAVNLCDVKNCFQYSQVVSEGSSHYEHIPESITLMSDKVTLVSILKNRLQSPDSGLLWTHLEQFKIAYSSFTPTQQTKDISNVPSDQFSVGSYSKTVFSVRFQALRLVEGDTRLVLVFGVQTSDSEDKPMDGLVIYRDLENPSKSGWQLTEASIPKTCETDHTLLTRNCDQLTVMKCTAATGMTNTQKGTHNKLNAGGDSTESMEDYPALLYSTFFNPLPHKELVGEHVLSMASNSAESISLRTVDPEESLRFSVDGARVWNVSRMFHDGQSNLVVRSGRANHTSITISLEEILDDIKVAGANRVILVKRDGHLSHPDDYGIVSPVTTDTVDSNDEISTDITKLPESLSATELINSCEKDLSAALRIPLSWALEKVSEDRPADPVGSLSSYLRQWKRMDENQEIPTNYESPEV